MRNFSQVLKQSYFEVPDQVAVHLLHSNQPDKELSYRNLWHSAARYAHTLRKEGIQPGEVVILIQKHGADLVSSFFGTILHGAVPSIMPFLTEKLHPELYRASLTALFEITAPTAIITYAEFMDDAREGSLGTSVRAILPSEKISRITGDITPEDELSGLDSLPEEVVLLQHSSGTTGLQKGVALSHLAVFNQIESYARALQLAPSDVVVSWLPLYHDMGLIAGFIMPILTRTPLVLLSPFDWVRAPYRLMRAISSFRGTLCWLPNFAYNFCAQKIRARDLVGVDLSSLRAVINCSEPMYWESHAMFLDHFQPYGFRPDALATSYAMAENVFAVTQGGIHSPVTVDEIDQQAFLSEQVAIPIRHLNQKDGSSVGEHASGNVASVKMLSAGKPIEGTRLRVMNSQGEDLPERHIGEIALQSNYMLTGYYNRPDLTEKAFRDGWYLTGDLGYLAGGELYVTGRKKDLIIVGGKNIYPQDLERMVEEVHGVHPGRVVAFGVYNEQTGTEDIILIAEVEGLDLSGSGSGDADVQGEVERIAGEIRQRVTRGSEVALRYVHLVGRNWLIKTSSGKVARRANRDKYLAEVA